MKTQNLSSGNTLKFLPISIMLLVGASFLAQAESTEQINKRFGIQPGGTLVVEVDLGSIDIKTNGTSEVVADITRKVSRRNKAEEETYFKEHPVEFIQDGNKLTIRCREKTRSNGFWLSTANKNQATYVITVPAQFNAKATTAGGGISVIDLTGEVKASTSGGPLHFARLHGPLNGDTSGGSIRLSDCEGALKIDTSGGGIDVAGGSGSLEGDTSGGSISVKNFRGSTHVHTSGGGITLVGVVGVIKGETSGGSIKALLPSRDLESVRLETSGGGITISVPPTAAFELDAETSAGGVSSDLPVTGNGGKNGRLKGTVNGGGKPMVLRSSAGSIHVRQLAKAEQD